MEFRNGQCFIGGVGVSELAGEFGTPLYVYEEDIIKERFRSFRDAITYRPLRLLYACKANSNLEVMRTLIEEGCGIDATSPGEVYFAVEAGCKPENILLTGSNMTDAGMAMVRHYGVMINIDSVAQLERYGKAYPGTGCSLRINPEVGAGAHEHVVTGGPNVKFGIMHDRLSEALGIAKLHRLKIAGAHMHIGSNILDHAPFIEAVRVFLKSVRLLPDLKFVDLGGGFGIPYSPGQKPADLKQFGEAVSGLFASFCRDYGSAGSTRGRENRSKRNGENVQYPERENHPGGTATSKRPPAGAGSGLTLVFENGRYYVAEAGHLLVRVVDVKKTRTHVFVGTDSGFTHLVRPALYEAYHGIVNCTNPGRKAIEVSVVGNICETGDYFARHRMVPEPLPGDILSIENAGAYCYSMASPYNARPRPAEVMVSAGEARIVRSRESYDDLLRGQRQIINIAYPWGK
jgi:diaminopimelate decarboxylase